MGLISAAVLTDDNSSECDDRDFVRTSDHGRFRRRFRVRSKKLGFSIQQNFTELKEISSTL